MGTTRPLTLREAADVLGLHWKTVYRLVRVGRLPAMRYGVGGGSYRIELADLEAFKASHRVAPPVEAPVAGSCRVRSRGDRAAECADLGLDVNHEFR